MWGALLETGHPNGVATLVSLGDATTSLYTTGGFGIIGAGFHEVVAAATRHPTPPAAMLGDAHERLADRVAA